MWVPPTAAQQAGTVNLLANPDFRLGRQFWQPDVAGKTVARFDVNSDDSPDGSQSALLTLGAVESWGVQFGQAIDGGQVGKTYTFAVMARSAGEPVKVRLEIERRANPYDRAAQSQEMALTKERWSELHVTFKVDKPFREGWFAYVSCAQANARFRLAQFRLVEGNYTPFQQQHQQELAMAGVGLFDTTAPSAAPLTGSALAKRDGWTAIPEDNTTHAFKGDAVLMNNRLALVLRAKGNSAEFYSIDPAGIEQRATLKPAIAGPATLAGVKILENSPASAAIEATFKAADGKLLTVGYELKMGQVFVAVNPGDGNKAIRVEAPCRFAVMPDFFADDIVADARSLNVDRSELPSEHFLLHMLGDGQAILMEVWNDREDDVAVTLSGDGSSRRIDSADIPCGNKGKVWVAVLSAPGIWHTRDFAAAEAGKIMPLEWKAPLPAMWRIDWQRDDHNTDSWEMILQRPGGDFLKYGLVGSAQTIPADRRRWTTVLGTFSYPCWIDKNGQAFCQPLKSKARFVGPAIVYPLGRAPSTPLDAFSVVDIVRATLGVGPCEYILDIEGQQSQYKGRATCANRDTLNPIYEKGQQVQRKAEIEQSLAEVIVFIRHIRSRIEGYVEFGHGVLDYLADQKKSHPELDKPIGELEALARNIDLRVAARRSQIKTPEEAAAMIEAFRKDGLDDTSPGAFDKCKKFTASIVDIGGNQDELVGECRLAVRILRQRAALAAAGEARLAEISREIRSRSQKVLRNPAGHEGARH
jgi:hypothetical protein